jgi:hypothetical protein
MRCKVAAILGNCILGYRLQLIKFKQEWLTYSQQEILFAITAIGDAVELQAVIRKQQDEASYSEE